jgi:hypothetical protein
MALAVSGRQRRISAQSPEGGMALELRSSGV